MDKLASRLPRTLSFVVIGLLFVMPVWTFVAVWLGETTNTYEFWRGLPSVLIFVVTILTFGSAAIWKPKIFKQLITDKITLLILALGVLMLLSVWLGEATWRAKLVGLAMDSRFLLAFLSARLLSLLEPNLWRSLFKYSPKFLLITGVALSVIGLVQVTLLPKDFLMFFGYSFEGVAPYVSIDQGDTLRAFATMSGPNNYANYLLITLLAAAFLISKTRDARQRTLYCSAAAVIVAGLVASSSRAAWLAAALALVVYFLLNYKISRKVIIGSALGLVLAAIVGVLLLEVPLFRENILHIRNDRDSSTVTSNDAHVDALADGVDQVVDEPLGCGVGCAGPASYYSDEGLISENYYLQIAQEYGVIGAGLFVAIFGLILVKLWRDRTNDLAKVWLAVGVGLAFAAMFAHTFTDESVSLTWFMLAGGLLGLPKVLKAKS